MKNAVLAGGLAGAALLVLLAGAPARAATQSFTINELGGQRFTSDIVGCASGSWADDVQVLAPAGQRNQSHAGRIDLIIHTVYTCDEAGNSILVTKEDHIVFGDTELTGVGQFRITGGTGTLSGISGHGVDTGYLVYDTGETASTITGVLTP